MTRRTKPQAPKPPDWPPEKTYAALKTQVAELDAFRGKHYKQVENAEQGWRNLTENILTHGFGEGSNNLSQFYHANWAGEHYMGGMSEGLIQNNFDARLEALDAALKSSLAELELIMTPMEPAQARSGSPVGAPSDSRQVFLVHGHDKAVREEVARFVEKLDLEPIILHEQPNMGRTVIEKFEAHADVRFAVVLLTPDDVGGLASGGGVKPRARQNVILELGYFIGRLGRARVCALYVEGVEIPSDIHGVVYVAYDAAGGWRLKLASEIRAAGLNIDMNRA
jgi:predicted nucleotide-binding protein